MTQFRLETRNFHMYIGFDNFLHFTVIEWRNGSPYYIGGIETSNSMEWS
jgi:hypothetical protein